MNPKRINGEVSFDEFVDSFSPALPLLGLFEFFA
jgi:hypothetical protein